MLDSSMPHVTDRDVPIPPPETRAARDVEVAMTVYRVRAYKGGVMVQSRLYADKAAMGRRVANWEALGREVTVEQAECPEFAVFAG